MSYFENKNESLAAEILDRYPVKRSALIPLLHLAQSQDGFVSPTALKAVAELTEITPAEALGTASFYEMFKLAPTGEYQVNICRGISCALKGADQLIAHAESSLGIAVGSTTADRKITLNAVECIAACTEAPCMQTNYRYHYRIDNQGFDEVAEKLKGEVNSTEEHEEADSDAFIPNHGVISRVFQHIPQDRRAGAVLPSDSKMPKWLDGDKPALGIDGSANKNDSQTILGGIKPISVEELKKRDILVSRFNQKDSHTLQGYLATGGYAGLKDALAKPPSEVHEEVKNASLLGRGGAGFPAGVKWGFCPPDVWPRYLVVNGDESEPGTYKDRKLMENDPHQLIEGCLIACYAIGMGQCFLYVRGEMALAAERITAGLNEAYEAGLVGKNILGTDFSVDIVLHSGAGAYIVGEETALIESLEGRRGMPRIKPPRFPAADGVYSQPTIVNNVETLSNLGWIVSAGADTFTARGGESSTGTRIFAVSGHVRGPGVFEVPFGTTTFRQLIFDYAGGLSEQRSLKAFIPGGASAPWFFEEHLDMVLDKAAVDEAGSMLGSGAVVVMDDTTDIVKACHNLVRFFAHESCGKCTPCREGTDWLEKILDRILSGLGRRDDIDLLMDICDNISPGLKWPPQMTTICPLGPSAVSPVKSALDRFPEEFEKYIDASMVRTVIPVRSDHA